MKTNLGTIDRIVRVLILVTAVILFVTGTLNGALGITLLVIGGILAVTSVVSFCPIYALLGMNSCPAKKAQ